MKKLLSVLVAGALAAGVAPLASAAEEGGTLDRAKGAVKRQVDKAKAFHQRNVAKGTTGTVNPQVGERPTYPRAANTPTENRSASARADTPVGSGSAAAGTGAGAMSRMGSGDSVDRNDRYASDRDRTRERAQRWAQERNR